MPTIESYLRGGWPRTLLIGSALIPILRETFSHTLSTPAFTPRQVLHDGNLLPMIFAPWSGPKSLAEISSRVFLAVILLRIPRPSLVGFCQWAYPIWVVVALARTLEGFILSRGVGWVYPPLFRHWALYEPTSGLGPILTILFLLESTTAISFTNPTVPQTSSRILRIPGFTTTFRRFGYFPLSLSFSAISCWLESAPWTYGTALLCAAVMILVQRVVALLLPSSESKHAYSVVPLEPNLEAPYDRESLQTTNQRKPSLAITLIFILASISVLSIPYKISSIVEASKYIPMPRLSSASSPLLEIVILTYPRPADVEVHTTIIQTTVQSYLPILDDQTQFSIYTQAKEHPALENAIRLSRESNPNITISHHINRDSYPNTIDGHYLHLSEAFRWVLEKRPDHQVAEWMMLIEDDFPLCAGEIGNNALREVLTILEASRPSNNPTGLPRRRAGFIGAGGSGLIFHRSLLPVLQLVLRTYAETESKLPEGTDRRAPDLILQDCVLGKDPLCPQASGEICPDQHGEPSSCGLTITSRMIMDHIGGLTSTNRWKGPSDRWKCGWRHPFHGMAGVEVVVVDW